MELRVGARFRARFTGFPGGSGLDSRFTGFPGLIQGRLEEAGRSAVGEGRSVVARCAVRDSLSRSSRRPFELGRY